ncbi:MAG: S8 family serine peptidase [Chloroflexi bacterium]|nr:S8 family serine peptidase [Chloroflexota bacterium]
MSGCPAGDGVIDLRSIGGEAAAKNPLIIGAAESTRPTINSLWGQLDDTFFTKNPIKDDPYANNPRGIAAFSSRGPANDGRILPQLVAPGTAIVSARTRDYVFSDTVTANPGPWTLTVTSGSGVPSWTFQSDGGHSGPNYWRQQVTGDFTSSSPTLAYRALMNATTLETRPVGAVVIVQFWGRWSLSGDAQLRLVVRAPAASDETPVLFTLDTGVSGTQSSWAFRSVPVNLREITPTIERGKVQLGFALVSPSNTFTNARAEIDDVTIGPGGDFFLFEQGLATPGSAVDQGYVLLSGTSMATPIATGAATLVREWLQRTFPTPSAALLKAVLVNGAVDIAPGQYGTGPSQEVPATRPNNVAGFGRIDVLASLGLRTSQRVLLNDVRPGLATGESATFTVTAASGAFRATLAWTDYPSELNAARNLVNDLDLEVALPDGTTRFGNGDAYPSGNSVLNDARANCLAGGHDRCNPIEQVALTAGPAGVYRITVRGVNIPQGELGGKQPFALVLSFTEGTPPPPPTGSSVFLPGVFKGTAP